jgi:S-adenosylmethionine/arginine decarboxylase-like enzyme
MDAIRASGATIESYTEKKFEPQGYSLVVLISESHASVHTFPEHGMLFVDYFTCGGIKTEYFKKALLQALRPAVIFEDRTLQRPENFVALMEVEE